MGIEQRSYVENLFDCPVCEPDACPKQNRSDFGCFLVREPGICGCCFVCAIDKGAPCGLSRGRCAPGLRCRPPIDDPHPIRSLLLGQGVCL
ncbi:hypothetical protein LOTGIDRAFT_136747 [Lottia gigantea]|uniref:IGFBP N-terminal domain-containing protein n=1 Tax=Lottia gigantea TaxID=225164 RepID=V4B1E2_LOTGI|nr:hypothetical protein LOTGIDRAFT_136747 [Lottia gigantea]ESP04138.1 hypothetical protein LOTGIDRAFT_136747 [Lottia gigantea]